MGAGAQQTTYSDRQKGRGEAQKEEKDVLERAEEGIDSGNQGGNYPGRERDPGEIYAVSQEAEKEKPQGVGKQEPGKTLGPVQAEKKVALQGKGEEPAVVSGDGEYGPEVPSSRSRFSSPPEIEA